MISFEFERPNGGRQLGDRTQHLASQGREQHGDAPTLQRHLAARPRTKREADVVALKLFCLFSFILVGLIMAGVL